MRRQRLGAGLAMLVVALFVGGAVPAFADDAPPPPAPSTTEPVVTDPSTPTADPSTPAPDPTAPDTIAPDSSTPDTTTPDTTAPDTTAPDTTAPAAVDTPTALVNPAVTVTPSTGLVTLQTVTISGTGFTPSTGVGWAECKNNGSGDGNDCDVNHT